MSLSRLFPLLLLAGIALDAGCSSGDKPAEPSTASGEAASTEAEGESPAAEPVAEDVRKVPSASLPPTEGVSPAVDGGRLQIPLLAKWFVPPRSSEWLFRLQRDRKTAYPQILVTVDESFQPQIEKLNKANVADFVPVWQKHLDEKHDADVFGERVTAVRIGKRYGVECLINSVAGKSSLEQLMVSMIGAGRVYTLELRAQRGTLEDYRMEFYAVVAGTAIEAPAATPGDFEPMKTTPAEEPPGESEDAAAPAKTDSN